jgi:hypothetical protein
MSARAVEREARVTCDQFREFIHGLDFAEIQRVTEKHRRFGTLFGTPYGGAADDLFRRLREQDDAVAERAGDPRYWVDPA